MSGSYVHIKTQTSLDESMPANLQAKNSLNSEQKLSRTTSTLSLYMHLSPPCNYYSSFLRQLTARTAPLDAIKFLLTHTHTPLPEFKALIMNDEAKDNNFLIKYSVRQNTKWDLKHSIQRPATHLRNCPAHEYIKRITHGPAMFPLLVAI